MNAQLVGNMPYLATLPSCVLYLRPFGTASGGTTFKDWSPNLRGIVAGGSAQNSTAQIKYPPASILLNGTTDYVAASATSADFTLTGAFLISIWVRFSTVQVCTLFSSGSSTSYVAGGGWDLSYFSGNLCFEYQYGGAWVFSGTVAWTPTTGVWYNVIIYRPASSSTITAYVNGSSLGTIATSAAAITGSYYVMTAGRCSYSNTIFFAGNIDEAAIWNATASAYPIPTPAMVYPTGGQTRRLIV